jgi:hypothetical protein
MERRMWNANMFRNVEGKYDQLLMEVTDLLSIINPAIQTHMVFGKIIFL